MTLAVGAMVVFVASLMIWTAQVDRGVRAHEQDLVRRGISGNIAEIERSIIAETNWDEAILNLDNRFDAAWADNNLNDHYAQSMDFERLFVLDGADRPIYARRHRETASPAAFGHFEGAAGLVAEVRRAEAKRGPIAARRPGTPMNLVSHAIQSSAFVSHEGRVYLVTATLVQPDFAMVTPKGPRAPVVVMALALDRGGLDRLRERFQLSDLRAVVGDHRIERGRAKLVLDVVGGPPLIVTWAPQRPGADLLSRAILPVTLVILAFAAMGTIMVFRARRATAHLLASHRSQSEFLANMSHEVRTPLNGVSAIAEALERTSLTPAQAEMVGIIRDSGASLERLLSDVLDLSRIETGAVSMENAPFHLADAIRDVAALAAAQADEKAIDLIVDIDPIAETAVAGDAPRVKQVLANLVSNAVKFTSDGYVAIAVRADGEGRWRIEVQDTGIGFDPAEKDRLFNRFQQADGSVTRRFGGSGLGLAICKQLVDLMGGELDAIGAPGQGATFTLRLDLPLAAAGPTAASAPVAQGETAPYRPLRILLADDHPTNRKVVQVLFSEFDVDLVCTENGRDACEAFAAQRFDLVLMDMQMPVMDGLTAVREIRAREKARGWIATPIVMLTANTLPEHQVASLAAGADLHMAKPIEAAKLFAVLQNVAEAQAVSRAA
ncbi:ATP-binding protein [Phenylobacterium sp.]|uniref:hybrid sensor histidine kinase/response regulator n=1 Tax=Phenylobacterium sp. TaxID=1871053 RepID=UPI002734D848|nr:ATP-binding protein [Phenylobacterium sp.]MDP3853201.1 ATP-binding protein [Phenylobacterium sp.]